MAPCHIYLIPLAKTNHIANLKVKRNENRLDSKFKELPSHMAKSMDTGGGKLAPVRQTPTVEESKCKF